jgi:hypothetical protein
MLGGNAGAPIRKTNRGCCRDPGDEMEYRTRDKENL